MTEPSAEYLIDSPSPFVIGDDCRIRFEADEFILNGIDQEQITQIVGEYLNLKPKDEEVVYAKLTEVDKKLGAMGYNNIPFEELDGFLEKHSIEGLHYFQDKLWEKNNGGIKPRAKYKLYKDTTDWLGNSVLDAYATQIDYLKKVKKVIEDRFSEDDRSDARAVVPILVGSIRNAISSRENRILSDQRPRRNWASDGSVEGTRPPEERQFSLKSRPN